jgi:hypothetical protein
MTRRTRIAFALETALLLFSVAARAEDPPTEGPPIEPPEAARGLSIGGGLEGSKIYCTGCKTDDSAPGYLGLFLEPSYRVAPAVSLGVIGAYSIRPGYKGTADGDALGYVEHESLWRATGELRLGQPGRKASVWFALEAGVSGAYHSVNRYGSVNNPGFDSAWQNAPVVGMGAGVEGRISRTLALGADLRFLAYFFSNPNDVTYYASTPSLDVYHGTQPSLTLGIFATYDVLAVR